MSSSAASHRQQPIFTAERQGHKSKKGAVPGGVPANGAETMPPVVVDDSVNRLLLERLTVLEGKIDRLVDVNRTDVDMVRSEVADIAGRIRITKLEMSQLRHPLSKEDKFETATQELGAVVKSTEQATTIILDAAERVEEIIQELRAQLGEGYHSDRLNDMREFIVGIYEACNFQDLTGQRINKIVRALSFIEERVQAMISAWNIKEFETLPLPVSTLQTDGDLELHGPGDETGKDGSISQADIDALFD
jgi:chemotaxis protein CheZ